MVGRVLRTLGIAALVIGYPFLAHYTNAEAHDSSLGALVAVTPLLLIALLLAWRSPRRMAALGLLLLACLGLAALWSVLRHHFGLVYLLQHVGMQLALLLMFGRTLIGGRQPLCTRFAEAVHTEPLQPGHEAYARQVTIAWTLFFAAMALISILLFVLAPLSQWSLFANFMTLPLVALMFVAEFSVRRWLFPDLERAQLLDAVRAFRNSTAR